MHALRMGNLAGQHAVHFGSDGDIYYLTMDLVEGGRSLHTALKNVEDPPTLKWRLKTLVEVHYRFGVILKEMPEDWSGNVGPIAEKSE
ncbi:MAG: hypothetical protein IIC57_09345, partial [Proteobacteria bacterium]|nr:hypothetical protein [Pseudomonadota bacterium]